MDIADLSGSKKGIATFSLILVVIIGAIILVLLLVLVFKIGRSAEDAALESRCRNSVLAYAKLNSLPFGSATADPGDIECPTQFVTVEKGSPLAMKREIANMMYKCWENYGEGKLLLFRATDMKFCAICNVFQFEDKTTRLDHFTSFLMSERIPKRTKEGYAPTYYDYIAGTNTGTIIPDSSSPADTTYLDGSKRYLIAFTYYKESWWYKLRNFLIAGAVTAVAVAGATAITVFTAGVATPVAAIIIGASATAAGGIAGGAAAAGTTGADWQARLIMMEYSPQAISELGCEELPISMVDARFS